MPQITINLSDSVMTKLQQHAKDRQISPEEWVELALSDVLDEEDTRSEEQILESFRSALKGALSGDLGSPAHEVLDEIRRELTDYAHES